MDELDNQILRGLGEMPLVEKPFGVVANKLGLDETEIISRTKKLMDEGIIRRIGVSIVHRRAGVGANAMCMVSVPNNRIDSVGRYLSSLPEVTHCYTRDGFDYNMFFMIHFNKNALPISQGSETTIYMSSMWRQSWF